MSQKLIIGTLVILIVAVVGYGLTDTGSTEAEDVTENQVLESQPVVDIQVQSTEFVDAVVESQPTEVPVEVTREPQVLAQENVGDVWSAEGTILELEDFGMTLQLVDASNVFVELGPTDFWQAQAVPLAVGDTVQVDGWNNGEQIHARVVTTENGEIALRSETSQPLWSGGASGGQGQNGTHDSAASGQTEFQVAPEDWITVTGVLTKVSNGQVTMQTAEGEVYTLQMGQPNFWQSQGVTLSNGDEVEVLGFWMNGQFAVGDITKVATGEHIILRDPNGRQLWGGPGRNGNRNGNGNDSSGTSNSATNGNGQQIRGNH